MYVCVYMYVYICIGAINVILTLAIHVLSNTLAAVTLELKSELNKECLHGSNRGYMKAK